MSSMVYLGALPLLELRGYSTGTERGNTGRVSVSPDEKEACYGTCTLVKREQVPEQFRETFDALTAESGGVITSGPGSITINSPEMARRRNHLTSYLRYETTFPKRIQELAIITTARATDCPYVWMRMHRPPAGPG